MRDINAAASCWQRALRISANECSTVLMQLPAAANWLQGSFSALPMSSLQALRLAAVRCVSSCNVSSTALHTILPVVWADALGFSVKDNNYSSKARLQALQQLRIGRKRWCLLIVEQAALVPIYVPGAAGQN